MLLVRDNKRLEASELDAVCGERVEDAAQLEGITLEQALERRRGFRYLY